MFYSDAAFLKNLGHLIFIYSNLSWKCRLDSESYHSSLSAILQKGFIIAVTDRKTICQMNAYGCH